MKVRDLISKIDNIDTVGNCDCNISGVVCDSRFVHPGSVFVAIPGVAQDGWQYVGDALARGAVAIVGEHDVESFMSFSGRRAASGKGACYVQVQDARLALAYMAAAFYDDPASRLVMVGITGTNGKTTTAYLVDALFKAANMRPGMLTTVKYDIGERLIPAERTTPAAPELQDLLSQMNKVGCQSAVMEVSSHAIVQKRIAGIDFDIAVFTNLTGDHLDYHKSMEHYFTAKAALFYGLGRGDKKASAVINIDDEWGRRLVADRDNIKAEIITYGISHDADIRAENIDISGNGCRFHLITSAGETDMHIKLLGRYNVSNVLAAAGVGMAAGIDFNLLVKVLSGAECVAGRLELVGSGDDMPHIFVDYAHTDDALKNVLQTLREITEKRLIVVFGCGGDRDRTKRPAMGRIACDLADYSVLTSDNPRTEDPLDIIREIESGFSDKSKYEVEPDRRAAINKALEIAGRGDVVVIAGKGHENFQEFRNTKLPFDDRQVVRNALGVI